jgi:hypothetical protein
MRIGTLAALTLVCAVASARAQDPERSATPLQPHAELNARLRALGAAHEGADVFEVARSRGGRAVLGLRISDGSAAVGRPGILVVANVDGPEVWTSALALSHAERLLAAGDEAAAGLLANAVVYVVPRLDVDAAEARFATPLAEVRATGPGRDDDRDGREGEDPPADVDGDGVISWMRWPDPEGTWILDPTDPRAMVEADPARGELGVYRVSVEGRDLDGDERVAEDAPLNAVVNENFAQDWVEHGVHSGRFPTDEPEVLGMCEFMLAHPDIALVLTYGELDTLVEAPKSVKSDAPSRMRVPQPGVLEPDAELLKMLGKRYAAATKNETKGRGVAAGSFQEWVYQQRGLLSLAVCPWDLPQEAEDAEADDADAAEAPDQDAVEVEEDGADEAPPSKGRRGAEKKEDDASDDERKPSDEAKRLAWIDSVAETDDVARFVPWRAFAHPELGAVEVGGFAPYARREPPAARALELEDGHFAFLTGLAEVLPRLALDPVTARSLGNGLWEIEADLVNRGRLPLQSASGERTRAIRPARLRLVLADDAQLIAGEARHLVSSLDGSGGRRSFRWLVRAGSLEDVRLEVDTDNAGTAQARPEESR